MGRYVWPAAHQRSIYGLGCGNVPRVVCKYYSTPPDLHIIRSETRDRMSGVLRRTRKKRCGPSRGVFAPKINFSMPVGSRKDRRGEGESALGFLINRETSTAAAAGEAPCMEQFCPMMMALSILQAKSSIKQRNIMIYYNITL